VEPRRNREDKEEILPTITPIYVKPSQALSASVPKKMEFRGEMTNHHRFGPIPLQIPEKTVTLLNKQQGSGYTFALSPIQTPLVS
jgi:hypothetical protein